MSPHFTNSEVKKKHLRRVPVLTTPNFVLAYENEKCANPETCPDKQRCKKCHNEKEFMYHPLVYMTAKCNNGPSCKNRSRFCAFYHTEAERIESERNREELLRKLNRQKTKRSSSTTQAIPSKWNTENPTITNALGATADANQKNTKLQKSSSTSPNDTTDSSRSPSDTHSVSEISNSRNSQEDNISNEMHQGRSTQETFAGNQFMNSTHSDSNDGQISGTSYNTQVPSGYNLTNRETNGNMKGTNGFPRYTQSSGQSYSQSKSQMNASNYGQSSRQFLRINEKIRLFPHQILSKRTEGVIYEGVYLDHGIEYPVAVKEIELRFLGNDVLNHENLLNIQHRNLVRYHSICYKNDRVYIVMDLHTQTLTSFLREDYSRIRSSDNVLSPLCKSLLHQLCTVIVYLQTEQQIAHCDLLPDNIFIEMHQDDNHRIILGDMNRTRVRQHCNDDADKNRNETFRYIPPMDWNSPEETSLTYFTLEQMFQSDMWRVGMLIFYIITGEPYSPDNTPKFHINMQPWSSLTSVLLQRDHMLRLNARSLLHHPVFWYYLPSRVGDFYKQIFMGSVDISSLLSKIDNTALLFPRNNWLGAVLPDNNFPYSAEQGNSVLRLIQLIVDVVTHHQFKDEYYSAVMHQCTQQRQSDPILFFQKNFPCLLFKMWEILFREKKQLEKQQNAFSELLSC